MAFINLQEEKDKEVIPGFRVKFIHTKNMTFAHWYIKAGAQLPDHSHPHEQVTTIIDGKLHLTINNKSKTITRGDVAVIPSNVIHKEKAITECYIIDVFYPVRQDFK